MCHAEQLPGGEALRQGEFERHLACGTVGMEAWHEGRCLIEVGAERGNGCRHGGVRCLLDVWLAQRDFCIDGVERGGFVSCCGHRSHRSTCHHHRLFNIRIVSTSGFHHAESLASYVQAGDAALETITCEADTFQPPYIELVKRQRFEVVVFHGEVEQHRFVVREIVVAELPGGVGDIVIAADEQ